MKSLNQIDIALCLLRQWELMLGMLKKLLDLWLMFAWLKGFDV